jgi:hypothetical protein
MLYQCHAICYPALGICLLGNEPSYTMYVLLTEVSFNPNAIMMGSQCSLHLAAWLLPVL